MDYPSLAALKVGDPESWVSLSALLAPKIRNIIRFVLKESDLAVVEDLESACFSWLTKNVITKKKKPKFNSIHHLEARAIIKARSLAIDYIRRESKSPITHREHVESNDREVCNDHESRRVSPEDELAELELTTILMNLLNKINPKQREVLKLVVLENNTLQEAANVLGMPLGTVGTYRSRGLENIKQEISRHPHLLNDLNHKYGTLKLTLEIAFMALLLK